MVDKIPVKAVFTGAVVTALAEFGATDTTPIAQGGTGSSTPAAARSALGAELEAGAMMPYARNTAPSGWLKANGALISRTTYAALFAAIGTTFGVGDGSTTFAVPDMRGEFLRGWDDGRGIDAGRVFGTAQADAFKSHVHLQTIDARYNPVSGGGNATYYAMSSFGGAPANSDLSTQTAGGTETRPRNIAHLVCIKY